MLHKSKKELKYGSGIRGMDMEQLREFKRRRAEERDKLASTLVRDELTRTMDRNGHDKQ